MSILSVTERPQRGGKKGAGEPREFDRAFQVVVSSVDDTENDVLAADPVFAIGSLHPRNTGAWLNSVDAQAGETDPLVWEVTLRYTTAHSGTGKEPEENPLDDPPEYEWFFIEEMVVITKDVDGVAITNSSGEQPDPVPEIVERYVGLRITRNEASFNIALAIEFMCPYAAVNDDIFMDGVAQYEAKLAGMSGRQATRNDVVYWIVTYELHFRKGGWEKLRFIDQGYQILTAGGYPQVLIDPTTRQRYNEPQLLDGNGQRLEGWDVYPPPAPVFREYFIYQAQQFADLGLF